MSIESFNIKTYNIFKYLLSSGVIYSKVMKYKLYPLDDLYIHLILTKNGSRCEMSVHDFRKKCASINNEYYQSIMFDYKMTSSEDLLVKDEIAQKAFLNSLILLLMHKKFYGVNLDFSVNDMLDVYLNLDDRNRKNLINHLRGTMK